MTKKATTRKPAAKRAKKPAAVVASNSGAVAAFRPWGFAPAAEAKATRAGSKRAALIDALFKGKTLAELVTILGWGRSTVTAALRVDAGALGYGVERVENPKGDDRYKLVLPAGMKKPLAHH